MRRTQLTPPPVRRWRGGGGRTAVATSLSRSPKLSGVDAAATRATTVRLPGGILVPNQRKVLGEVAPIHSVLRKITRGRVYSYAEVAVPVDYQVAVDLDLPAQEFHDWVALIAQARRFGKQAYPEAVLGVTGAWDDTKPVRVGVAHVVLQAAHGHGRDGTAGEAGDGLRRQGQRAGGRHHPLRLTVAGEFSAHPHPTSRRSSSCQRAGGTVASGRAAAATTPAPLRQVPGVRGCSDGRRNRGL